MARRSVYMAMDNDRWFWRLTDDDFSELAVSPASGYASQKDAEQAADRVINGDFRRAERVVIRPTT
jgi:hypothetical protein